MAFPKKELENRKGPAQRRVGPDVFFREERTVDGRK
jgi:hypothetical protein